MEKLENVYVWSDFGGVLTPPLTDTFAKLCRTLEVPAPALVESIGAVTRSFGVSDYMAPIDTPIVTEAEWISQIKEELETRGHDASIDTLGPIWFDGREVNSAWLETLRSAADVPDVTVCMISNMVPSWDHLWRPMVPGYEDLFHAVALSFELGARKPQEAMFAAAEKLAGAPEGSTHILIDDIEDNCIGARKAGWKAIHFLDATTARDELFELLPTPVTDRR